MDSKPYDLDLLATLDVLLAELNVTRAAKRLNVSQSALSARLARLRDLFGDPLLVPARRGMVPTQLALDLRAPLHDAMEAARQIIGERMAFVPADVEATVTIAASDYGQYALLMPLVHVLRHEAPGIRIAWRTLDVPTIAAQMERGEIDLALIRPEIAPGILRVTTVLHEHYVVIAREGHPAIRDGIDLDLFCRLDHIVVSPRGGGFRGPTDDALEAIGKYRRVGLSTSGFLMVPEVVARSDAIAVVPHRLVRAGSCSVRIFPPPLPVPGFDLAMIWHHRTTNHVVLRWVRDHLAKLAAD